MVAGRKVSVRKVFVILSVKNSPSPGHCEGGGARSGKERENSVNHCTISRLSRIYLSISLSVADSCMVGVPHPHMKILVNIIFFIWKWVTAVVLSYIHGLATFHDEGRK